ncbi:MAG: DUF1549 domain-containing protein [Planctomycetaceae bacterium]
MGLALAYRWTAALLASFGWLLAATGGMADEPGRSAKDGLVQWMDARLAARVAEAGDQVPATVSDATYIRRASCDLIGLPPSAEDVAAFAADTSPDKRERLVDRLLADREAYAVHWLTFWSDALRNAYRGTGFIDNGRQQITGWLFQSLYDNKPYDQFAHELISPVEGSGGFTRGIKWRGVVNESQRPEIQAAQNVAQVFLATNIKCASCHDSFVNDWKLTDAYRLASVFAEQPLEIHHCDKPTGELSTVGYIDPNAGEIDATLSRDGRMRQLAELVTSRENQRFARTIVNRLWSQLMGRGIVEPLDNLDGGAFDDELLDRLAADLIAHDFDLKRTLRVIAVSQAYQWPADLSPREATDKAEQYVCRGPLVKRMSAEQFVDAVGQLTSVWPRPQGVDFTPDGRQQGGQLGVVAKVLAAAESPASADQARGLDVAQLRLRAAEAKWIWSNEDWRNSPAGSEPTFAGLSS